MKTSVVAAALIGGLVGSLITYGVTKQAGGSAHRNLASIPEDENLPPQFRGKPMRPGWWFILKESDLCVIASFVKVEEAHKERSLDSNNNIVVEYSPVEMRIDQILFASLKMAFDGRFVKEPQSEYKVKPQYNGKIEIFLPELTSRGAALRGHPQLPKSGIFILEKSNHKKEGKFLISTYSGIEKEDEYRKALSE